MYKNKAILAVITARGGSKGIPRKNIKDLGGKPLIAYTIEAAKNSQYLDYFLVSTDDAEIAEVAKNFGAPVPFMRPTGLSTDAAKSIPVIQHAVNWLKDNEGKTFDYVMILQPTSPFRTAEDIDKSIEKIADTGADSVMGMKKLVDFSMAKLKVLDGDKILPLAESEGKESAARSELKDLYKRNCAIYLTKTDLIMRGDMFGSDSRAYLMPEERSIDINTPFDFELAEFMAQRQKISISGVAACALCGGRNTKILNRRGILKKGGPIINFDNVICKNCGLVFMSPQVRKDEYAAVYKKYENSRHGYKNEEELFGRVGDSDNGRKAGEVYGLIKEYLGAEKRVLDIGSGFGQIAAGLKNRFNCDVSAVEPSELLAKKIKEASEVNIFCGDFDAFLKNDSAKFNVLIMHHVFEHFIDPIEKLKQMAGLLLPDGAIYLEIPDVSSFKKPVNHFFDYCHPYSYSPKTFKELAGRSGYKIIKVNKENTYRLQLVIALKDSGYPDVGADMAFERGAYKQTAGFVQKRKIIDWLRI